MDQSLPNLKAEFTDIAHVRGTFLQLDQPILIVQIVNFLFVLTLLPHLDRQYSAFGKVIKGMEFVDMIKKGDPNSGAVDNPDKIISLKSK